VHRARHDACAAVFSGLSMVDAVERFGVLAAEDDKAESEEGVLSNVRGTRQS
jgi:hypothetical protein